MGSSAKTSLTDPNRFKNFNGLGLFRPWGEEVAIFFDLVFFFDGDLGLGLIGLAVKRDIGV